MSVKIISSAEAAGLIGSHQTGCSQGMGGNDVAEELLLELERRNSQGPDLSNLPLR